MHREGDCSTWNNSSPPAFCALSGKSFQQRFLRNPFVFAGIEAFHTISTASFASAQGRKIDPLFPGR